MKYIEISIKDILLTGKGFDDHLVSFPLDNPAVAASVRKLGIINPPVLITTAGQKYKVICGYKKILAGRKLGMKNIAAKVFDRGEIDGRTALLTAVTENAVSRGLNAVEIALAVNKLQKLSVPIDETVLKLLNIPRHLVVAYTGLLALDTPLKKAVAAGALTPAHAFLLEKLDPEDRRTLGGLFIRTMRPNVNEAKEIIRYLDDLKIRFSKDNMRGVLDRGGLRQIIADKKLNPREKVDRLRGALKTLRYPLITEKEDCFRQKLKNAGLPHSVLVSHSKYFEGNELKIDCTVRSFEELKHILAALSEKEGAVRDLLRIIKE